MDDDYPDDTAEEAELRKAAQAMKAFVPETWKDARMDAWQEQCRALEAARRTD